ncbi:TPA: hypothetical protein N0F65_006552 [Lagenidium giganteum]|uniref:Uncharacterized protein n=1 Tax=Lagenidium giganteum TaxID=4803 RepID=A0AAV2YQ70_9STRA|nr:TPA: hypothetical protein N0F65_006552 [Lagenidium giganteum]
MRSVVIPPVAIPSKLRSRRAVNTLVGGKEVALTRTMWENQKKRTIKRQQLDMIDEDSEFDYAVLRP